ncbi:hypothetical protein B0T16DRAFT_423277 [Cercophora newfieldiana]|uniref:Uncharacterized protein n=1 Tax=Cercophora newfieldiana TaxID=92897 RepID=A0AA39XUT6_9PEZI|nr:hypothetical protein B0T16DRAFT_423277 [Cercophora newfieldiana]
MDMYTHCGDRDEATFPLNIAFEDLINTTISYAKLETVRFHGISFHQEQFLSFLAGLPSTMKRVDFYEVVLLSGNWVESLDALRAKTYPAA